MLRFILLLFYTAYTRIITARIKYSTEVCARDTFCQFFNIEADRLRGSVFFNPRVIEILNITSPISSIYNEDIYDVTNGKKTREISKLEEIGKTFEKTVLGRAVYEVDGDQRNLPISGFLGNFNLKNSKNQKFSENPLKNLIFQGIIKQKLKRFQAPVNTPIFDKKATQMTSEEFERMATTHGIKICFKCLEKIALFQQISNAIDNRTQRSVGTDRFFDIGKIEGSYMATGLFDSLGQALHFVRRPGLAAPGPSTNPIFSDDLLVVFVSGRLLAAKPDLSALIPFRLIDMSIYDVAPRRLNLSQTGSFTPRIRQIETLYKKKQALKVPQINYKRCKLVGGPDDSDSFETLDEKVQLRTLTRSLILTPELCDGNSYCCLYNCNFEKANSINIFDDLSETALKDYQKNFAKKSQTEKMNFYKKYSTRDFGSITYLFNIDTELEKELETTPHEYFQNPEKDLKVTQILDYQRALGCSRTICINCLRNISVVNDILRAMADSKIKRVVQVGKDPLNNRISAILNVKGQFLEISRFRDETYGKVTHSFSSWLSIFDSLEKKYFGKYFVGFYGDEFCLIQKDLQSKISIHHLQKKFIKMNVKTIELENQASKARAAVFRVQREFNRYPKFRPKNISTQKAPFTKFGMFSGINGLPADLHPAMQGHLYEDDQSQSESEATPSNENSSEDSFKDANSELGDIKDVSDDQNATRNDPENATKNDQTENDPENGLDKDPENDLDKDQNIKVQNSKVKNQTAEDADYDSTEEYLANLVTGRLNISYKAADSSKNKYQKNIQIPGFTLKSKTDKATTSSNDGSSDQSDNSNSDSLQNFALIFAIVLFITATSYGIYLYFYKN